MSWTLTFANSPKGSNSLGNVDNEITRLKAEIKTIVEREHYFDLPVEGSDQYANQLAKQGRHRSGSARVYMPVGGLVLPDTTSWLEEKEGTVVWARVGTGALGQWLAYWNGTAIKWWPLSAGQVGEVKAHYGTFIFDVSNPEDPDKNTVPGWIPLDGRLTGVDTLTYHFGNGRDQTVSLVGIPKDLKRFYLKGAALVAGTEQGGALDPTFSITLAPANLPSHAHDLTDAAGVPAITVANDGAHDLYSIQGIGGGGYGLFWSGGLGAQAGMITMPAHGHGASASWPGGAKTAAYGSGTPTTATAVPERSFQEVTWIFRVL